MRTALIAFFILAAVIVGACSSNDQCGADPCATCQDPCVQADACNAGGWSCGCTCPSASGDPVVIEGTDGETTQTAD